MFKIFTLLTCVALASAGRIPNYSIRVEEPDRSIRINRGGMLLTKNIVDRGYLSAPILSKGLSLPEATIIRSEPLLSKGYAISESLPLLSRGISIGEPQLLSKGLDLNLGYAEPELIRSEPLMGLSLGKRLISAPIAETYIRSEPLVTKTLIRREPIITKTLIRREPLILKSIPEPLIIKNIGLGDSDWNLDGGKGDLDGLGLGLGLGYIK